MRNPMQVCLALFKKLQPTTSHQVTYDILPNEKRITICSGQGGPEARDVLHQLAQHHDARLAEDQGRPGTTRGPAIGEDFLTAENVHSDFSAKIGLSGDCGRPCGAAQMSLVKHPLP